MEESYFCSGEQLLTLLVVVAVEGLLQLPADVLELCFGHGEVVGGVVCVWSIMVVCVWAVKLL